MKTTISKILALAVLMMSSWASADAYLATYGDAKLSDPAHRIYFTACPPDTIAINGYCKCDRGGTWIAGIIGNGMQCACTGPAPDTISVLAVCLGTSP